MNKIVREHYPVANLPADLREGLMQDGTVRVVIEEANATGERSRHRSLWEDKPQSAPLSAKEAVALIKAYKATLTTSITQEEAVGRIRKLRDEWDDE